MLHDIIDLTRALDDGKEHPLDIHKLKKIAVHRVGVDLKNNRAVGDGKTPLSIGRAFIEDPKIAKYTGGEQPYTFYIDSEGQVYQALKLGDAGRHARRWNSVAVGIACIGDFRVQPPTYAQVFACAELCTELCLALGLSAQDVRGHSELPGGSSDPNKQCPGQLFNMKELRESVEEFIAEDAQQRLLRSGLIL